MPIIKLRDIGARGLIKDVIPHEVPDGWLTDAENVRFSARGILRYPTASQVYTPANAVWMSSCERGSSSRKHASLETHRLRSTKSTLIR